MRLLVASHDASRTGAPLLLLTFLRWVRRSTDTEVQLVLWRGGPLVDAFAEVADVTVLHPPPGRRSGAETADAVLAKLGRAERVAAWRAGRRLRVAPHDVCLLNGAGSALVAPHLPPARTVSWVHELDRGLTFSLRGPGRERFLGAESVVAVADVVADRLVDGWGVDRDRVTVLRGCLPDRVPGGRQIDPGEGPPLVASVGAGSWRKGIDLFVDVAAGVRERQADVRFAWVGPLDEPLRSDLVELPGEVADPTPWYERMAVFCATAREDPFPLVGLEAGAAGVPIVAFDSGGISELLADGRGTVVPPQDVDAMADAVVSALADPPSTGPLREHVAAHHTIDVMGPALWEQLRP